MKIAVLVAARKNSKYLAKFLMGYFQRTAQPDNTEILVMYNEGDTWNKELIDYFERTKEVTFVSEDYQLGRAGLHRYFNELLRNAGDPDWVVYFCEDHFITMDCWDDYVRKIVAEKQLDPNKVWVICPKFGNVGTMNHIVSRGFIKAMGDVLGQHGWIDSYINDVLARIPQDRIIKPDDDLFHDFTHDKPSPMDDSHLQSVVSEEGKKLPQYGTEPVRRLIDEDAQKINTAIKEGR